MPHGDFLDTRTRNGCHGRNEAMHFRVQRHSLDNTGAVEFERATIVTYRHACHFADQTVRDPRGHLAGQQLILAILAPTDDHVCVIVELAQHVRNIGRVVLQIPIHRCDNVSARQLNSCRHRGRLPVVRAKRNHAQPRVMPRDFRCDLKRSVRATVIDEENLVFEAGIVHRSMNPFMQKINAILLIVERNDNGNIYGVHVVRSPGN